MEKSNKTKKPAAPVKKKTNSVSTKKTVSGNKDENKTDIITTEVVPEVLSDNNSVKPLKNQTSMEDHLKTIPKVVKEENGGNDYVCIAVKQDEEQLLNNAEQTVKAQKTPRKKLGSFIFLILNLLVIAIILITQIQSGNITPLKDIHLNWYWLLAAVVCVAILMLSEQIRYFIVIRNSTKKARPFLSYKVAAIGKYYDAVTPLATGGQPFQVHYLLKRGVAAGPSISIPLSRYIFQQIAYTILTIVIMFTSLGVTAAASGVGAVVVSTATWIGFTLNFLLLALVVVLSISKRIGEKIVRGVLKLLRKMKIVKNYDKQYLKVMRIVDDYQSTIRHYTKNAGIFASMFFLSVLALIVNYLIPFFIYSTFAGFDINVMYKLFSMSVMIDLAAAFIPLPGGTGVAELSFTTLFAAYFTQGTLFWALLLWRLLSYFFYILQGLAILIYDFLIGNKKNERLKKKWDLENIRMERQNNTTEKEALNES